MASKRQYARRAVRWCVPHVVSLISLSCKQPKWSKTRRGVEQRACLCHLLLRSADNSSADWKSKALWSPHAGRAELRCDGAGSARFYGPVPAIQLQTGPADAQCLPSDARWLPLRCRGLQQPCANRPRPTNRRAHAPDWRVVRSFGTVSSPCVQAAQPNSCTIPR